MEQRTILLSPLPPTDDKVDMKTLEKYQLWRDGKGFEG